ncbi:MAG TPA: hypothetical protein V6D47_15075 [Oscillatoriaceae cyanobacterium]
MRNRWGMLVLVVGLSACAPLAFAPPAGGDYSLQSWGGTPLPGGPWRNACDDGFKYPWLVRGSWSSTNLPMNQWGTQWPWYGGAPPLSFMRYAARSLPAHYVVDCTFAVLSCDRKDPYYPIGDTGVQVFYMNPTHYCEVVYRPKTFEVWQCNGGVPYKYNGWSLLKRVSYSSRQGMNLHVHAEVDTNAHRLTVQLPNGGSVTCYSWLLSNQTHYMTLRASNNLVRYQAVQIKSL